jgi:hypothetical protein
MTGKSPSVKNVLAALPGVKAAIREEVAARVAAGETISGALSPKISPRIEARRIALEQGATRRSNPARKSAA